MMFASPLLACPLCALSSRAFIVLSILVGVVPVARRLLRPYTRGIRTWGWPRVTLASVFGLVALLVWLVPLWWLGRQHETVWYVAGVLAGIGVLTVYLWWRGCWLLQSHDVQSAGGRLLFFGWVVPGLFLLGMATGYGVVGALWLGLLWPRMLLWHVIPIGLFVGLVGSLIVASLRWIFADVSPVVSSPAVFTSDGGGVGVAEDAGIRDAAQEVTASEMHRGTAQSPPSNL